MLKDGLIHKGRLERDSSDNSDWSDPRDEDSGHDRTRTWTRDTVQDGISVPSFLQPLLGLDFVPYLPKNEVESPSKEEFLKDLEESDVTPFNDSAASMNDSDIVDYDSKEEPLLGPKQSNRLFRRSTRIRKAVSSSLLKMSRRKSGSRDSSWILDQQASLKRNSNNLEQIRERCQQAAAKASQLEQSMSETLNRVESLQRALDQALGELAEQNECLIETEKEIQSLQIVAYKASCSLQQQLRPPNSKNRLPKPQTANRQRSATAEPSLNPSALKFVEGTVIEQESPLFLNRKRASTDSRLLHSSSSFIRVNDLEIPDDQLESSLSGSNHSRQRINSASSHDSLFYIDQNIALILDKLVELGFNFATDESNRFSPIQETKRLLSGDTDIDVSVPGWPVSPWKAARGKEILVWTGAVEHKGFGHDWPVVKARCVVSTTPRELVEFLLDSSHLKKYNKMSQGRDDIVVLQNDLDITESESPYGFPGIAKVMRALNKPKLLPKTIEMLSLWHARPLEEAPGSYIIVNRSVWEDETGTTRSNSMIRSEMLLGVHLIRPCLSGCEITLITHVYAPGVPELIAKRMAPSNATTMLRDIQCAFPGTK